MTDEVNTNIINDANNDANDANDTNYTNDAENDGIIANDEIIINVANDANNNDHVVEIIDNTNNQPLLLNDNVVFDVNNNDDTIIENDINLLMPPTNHSITIDTIRDNIVSEATSRTYVPDILHFLYYCRQFAIDCLTDYCLDVLNMFQSAVPSGSNVRVIVNGSKDRFRKILRDSQNQPLVNLPNVTPDVFMEYLMTLRNRQNTAKFLSKSSYSNKRSSLFHLFRSHNKVGFSESFQSQMTDLLNGFFRQLACLPEAARRRRRGQVEGEPEPEGEGDEMIDWKKEDGKEPISIELLLATCGWFASSGDQRGIFAHTYLLITWNLACRTNNTSNIRLNDVVWNTSFDCFHILFRHSKTDQQGANAQYPRNIYANPKNPVVCPVLALGFYFSCCFSISETDETLYLFPGQAQERRFSGLFNRMLRVHEDKVRNEYGFEYTRLGPHSLRKGAATFLVSLPGGPPGAAVCLRGGWSMGGIKDRYWQYTEAGDHFVGRCLSLLPIMSASFASSPPYFSYNDPVEVVFVNKLVFKQFPAVCNVIGLGRLLRMCLASLIFHRDWIYSTFHDNHVVITDSVCHKDEDVTVKLREKPDYVVVSYPWNDDVHQFSGIPPHASLLQEVAVLRSQQTNLIDCFVDKVREAMSSNGYGPNRLTDESLQRILREFKDEFQVQVQRVIHSAGGESNNNNNVTERIENNKKYQPHFYGGRIHRVPFTWRFPKCNTISLWRQWWIGDDRKQIPPLQLLSIHDVKHIDDLPLSEEEIALIKPGRANQVTRRSQTKNLCDMRYLMRTMTQMVEEVGGMPNQITMTAVDRMFSLVSNRLVIRVRDLQKQWMSVVVELRRANRTPST